MPPVETVEISVQLRRAWSIRGARTVLDTIGARWPALAVRVANTLMRFVIVEWCIDQGTWRRLPTPYVIAGDGEYRVNLGTIGG